jgi:2-hydroxychromene-2-carboxylate isomerase
MSHLEPRVRFYFDYISSNAYLAWLELPKLAARYGAAVDPVPVLFAGLLEANGQLGPAEVPPKIHWMWKNNLRKAALLGVPLNPPAFHPFNPLLALRVSSLGLAESERTALVGGLFKAVWVERMHVSEPEVVEQVANAAGLDGARLVAEANTPESKARLRAETDDAIVVCSAYRRCASERNCSGAMTIFPTSSIFWPARIRSIRKTFPNGPGRHARRRFADASGAEGKTPENALP